jgi:DtxR family transcriptional regulator, Mn-dependent transcriptional regulator
MQALQALQKVTSSTCGKTLARRNNLSKNGVIHIQIRLIQFGENRITTVESLVAEKKQQMTEDEELYVGTAESEHIEMYLKAIWYIRERGEEVKVSSIAKLLNVTQPSVVQMLRKLNRSQFVRYSKGSVEMTTEGGHIGKKMMRNTRLLEVLMKDALKIEVDEEMICGIEHHMKDMFTDALCTLLKHPRKCPHGHEIPKGKCCS